MCNDDPIHVVMRYADSLKSVDTIGEHQAVIDKHGAAWIGKIGRPLGGKSVETVNKQCEEGIPTYLILVQKSEKNYDVFRCSVEQMALSLPPGGKKLVPKYYERKNIVPKFWVKVSKIAPIKFERLEGYQIASSGRRLRKSLRTSMAAMFVIKEGEGFDY